jgi:hypothetical protein
MCVKAVACICTHSRQIDKLNAVPRHKLHAYCTNHSHCMYCAITATANNTQVPRSERSAIVSLQLGSSSSGSLLALNARGSAKLYSLEVANSNETSSKGTYTPQVPQLLLEVCADDLKRPLLQRELAQWATGAAATTTAQSSTKKVSGV